MRTCPQLQPAAGPAAYIANELTWTHAKKQICGAVAGTCDTGGSGDSPDGVGVRSGGGPQWCRDRGYLCIWSNQGFASLGDYWTGSDENWHTGVGTNVVDDDDSVSNSSGLWVKVFHDNYYNGSCQWIVSSPADFSSIGNNDDGSSHIRSSSRPSC